MRHLLATALLLVPGALELAPAQNTIINRTYDPKTKTKVVVTALHSSLPSSGYLPIRVVIHNGTKIDRPWSFRFTSTDVGYSDEGNELRSHFSATCESGKSLALEFLVPLVTAFQRGYTSSTDLDLVVSAPALPTVSGSMDTIYEENWPAVLLSDTLHTRNGSLLTAEAQKYMSGGRHGGGSGSIEFGGQFNPEEISDDWRAYAGYDACLLTDNDWRELSPGSRSALLQWNRMGGSLVIYSSSGSTDCETLGIEGEPPGTRNTTRSWGAVRILDIPTNNNLPATKTVELVANELYRDTGRRRLDTLRNDFQPRWPLQAAFGSKTAHILLFIVVLIAFGILVGPVNLFVFAKSGQRHRLFVTTPVISVAASLLLILLILFQDGFGGRGRRLLLLEVRSDAAENAAYLCQEQIARTGVLLGTAFQTSEPGYLTPVLVDESRWARVTASNDGGSSRYTVDVEENGLELAGDWFQSRSEHGHLLETVRPTRGRIELVAAQPDPVVTSTFEFPLETLYFIDAEGTAWTAGDVRQGRNTKLTAVADADYQAWTGRQLSLFTRQNRKRLELTAHRRGHFVATSSEVPAIATLESINWRRTEAVITGPVRNAPSTPGSIPAEAE